MISFNPGPSKVEPEIQQYLNEAFETDVLSISHRSARFSQIYADVISALQEKLGLPADYSVFFFSSATECWSVLAESLIDVSSLHIFSGDFGQKWYEFTYPLCQRVARVEIEADAPFDEVINSPALQSVSTDFETVCFTQNETSNGSQIQPQYIQSLRKRFPGSLIAIDATSSLAGVHLPLAEADIWFASVQKCFGLPAGLAVMLLSPAAVAKIEAQRFDEQYNSLYRTLLNARKLQTTHTPNVLNIFLLKKVLEARLPIHEIDQEIKQRAKNYYQFFEKHKVFRPFVNQLSNRSDTVIALTGETEEIDSIKKIALQKGIQLGSGYGDLKSSTFRIANFPAHSQADIDLLLGLF